MIEEQLKAYLAKTVDAPMVWGESDCTMWPARWIEQARGVTLTIPKWESREKAHALMENAGSLVALWDQVLDGHLFETGAPEAGDVGVIESHLHGEAGGIFLDGGYFAWRAEPQGYRILHPRQNTVLKAWAIR
ncbi:MAG TPA: hypothetical protein VGO22_18640 [Pseudorhizobium sp.]|jgi:hypothetical protein|nr:hypothetical protein [Pseudorhizobium sp.]